jgi:hypothetical protein
MGDEGAHDHAAPLIGGLVHDDERHGVFDEPGDILVDRGDEQRFLVGEVRVRGCGGKTRIAADVGDRGASVALTGEADDGRAQEGLARAVALGRAWAVGHHAHTLPNLSISVKS